MISRTFYFLLDFTLKCDSGGDFCASRETTCAKLNTKPRLHFTHLGPSVCETTVTKRHVKNVCTMCINFLSWGFVSGQPQDRRVDLEIKNVPKPNKKTAGNQKIIVTPPLGGVTMIF